jgi:hypothetical protein
MDRKRWMLVPRDGKVCHNHSVVRQCVVVSSCGDVRGDS